MKLSQQGSFLWDNFAFSPSHSDNLTSSKKLSVSFRKWDVLVIGYFYRPQTKFAKVVFTGVCLSTGGGGLCPGGCLSGGSLSRGVSVRETPPYSNMRAVRILLECILVEVHCEFLRFSIIIWSTEKKKRHRICHLQIYNHVYVSDVNALQTRCTSQWKFLQYNLVLLIKCWYKIRTGHYALDSVFCQK